MLSAEIRQSFQNFFAGRGHQVLPSSSLVPHGDASLLLTNAGMVQFKPYYAGTAAPPAARIVTVQKCFRTVDLEEVGDASHLTFFEMLGNFSFGDYFKDGAIEMAWEYLTGELSLDAARLWPTAHPEDDEAAAIWRRVAGREPHRLADNYWPASLEGWVGPNGPDSEVYFDLGPGVGCGRADCVPGHCDRYLELWNLVFPQYDRQPDGSQRPLDPPGVDTGMGLERLAAVLAGVSSIHDTDVFQALNDHFRQRAQGQTGDAEASAYARRLLSDHARATAFLVADGVRPANEGRGYILRKMVRRATLHGVRRLGLDDGLSEAVPMVAELMGAAYPELLARTAEIARVLAAEEESFRRTLEMGEREFTAIAGASAGLISGADAFRLHDTFGFPIELTAELAAEQGLGVDRAGFETALAAQRQQSRRAGRRARTVRTGLPATRFTGYESLGASGTVVKLFRGDTEVNEAVAGDEVELYLDVTSMYAESGGQVGDIGVIEAPGGTVEVADVQRQGDAHAHYGTLTSGTIAVGDRVEVMVDHEARWATMRHHSATHLLHRALRDVLGGDVHQAGSYVGPETCTFDFTLGRGVAGAEIDAVFGMVNRAVRDDLQRVTRVMSLEDARQSGAMMLFDEKYGEEVRVVAFGDFSMELCGGTHVDRTGQIGLVTPVSERSVQAGVRRLEFLAGAPAERHVGELVGAARTAAAGLKVAPTELPARVDALAEERRRLQKELDELRRRMAAGGTAAAAGTRDGVAYQRLDMGDADLMRAAADGLLDRAPEALAAVVLGEAGRLVVKTRRGGPVRANDALAAIRARVGAGTGGGNETLAQGGGFAPEHIDDIVSAVAELTQASGSGA